MVVTSDTWMKAPKSLSPHSKIKKHTFREPRQYNIVEDKKKRTDFCEGLSLNLLSMFPKSKLPQGLKKKGN